MMEEAVLASRDFVNEGEFLPEVTSGGRAWSATSPSRPPLLGYVATTAKPQASTLLRIGPDRDPLLATLAGRAWAGRRRGPSDASDRWSQLWAGWDGYVDFWSDVVRDTFAPTPAARGAGPGRRTACCGSPSNGRRPSPTAPRPPPGSPIPTSTARRACRSSAPGRATSPARCRSATPAPTPSGLGRRGAERHDRELGSTLATLSYPPEFEPGEPDEAALARLVDADRRTGGDRAGPGLRRGRPRRRPGPHRPGRLVPARRGLALAARRRPSRLALRGTGAARPSAGGRRGSAPPPARHGHAGHRPCPNRPVPPRSRSRRPDRRRRPR